MIIRTLLIVVNLLFSISAIAETNSPEWRQKPVQCGTAERAMQILQRNGEKALLGGLTYVRTPNGQDILQPFYLFVNADTGTFTLFEYHLKTDEVCIVGYGSSIDFDVQKLFEPKTNS